MAVARDTGLIVGQAVSQERSLETFQALPATRRYASDRLAVYAELVWPEDGQYILSRRQEATYTIERLNANLRTYLKRLARSRRCFSRSLEALQRAVRLFVYHYNRRQQLYLAHPSYRGPLPLLF